MAHAATCTCGICGQPIPEVTRDYAYQLPDDVFALPPEERSPACTKDFAVLGGRYFVRGLLPVPLEGADDEFRYGIWIEVDPDTFDAVLDAWNDPKAYMSLQFSGTIANAFPPYGERVLGAKVRLAPRDARSRPFVTGTSDRTLRGLMKRGWTRAEHHALWAPGDDDVSG